MHRDDAWFEMRHLEELQTGKLVQCGSVQKFNTNAGCSHRVSRYIQTKSKKTFFLYLIFVRPSRVEVGDAALARSPCLCLTARKLKMFPDSPKWVIPLILDKNADVISSQATLS